jgi:butyryl-CoA dehydrogenase
MSPTAGVSDGLAEARAFAESVAGVLGRAESPETASGWVPGEASQNNWPEIDALLDELGWDSLTQQAVLAPYAGLAAVELGKQLAPVRELDRLLGGSPLAGDLIRTALPVVVVKQDGAVVRRPVLAAEPCPSADGLEVQRVLELGEPVPIDKDGWARAKNAWLAAGVGYLAGLGLGALELTSDYVRQRRAFGSTLAGLAPVQQLLAGAATSVRGTQLLAGEHSDADALAHAGPTIAQACAACQQVTGAIGFTLEYPLHRYTQRSRALATWNDALLDALIET